MRMIEDLEERVAIDFSKAKTVSGLDVISRVLHKQLDTVLNNLSKVPSGQREPVGERIHVIKVKINETYRTRRKAIMGASLTEVKKDLTHRMYNVKYIASIAFSESKTKEELRQKEKAISALTYDIKQDIRTKLTGDVQNSFVEQLKNVIDSIDLYYIENSKTFERELLGDRVNMKPIKRDQSFDRFLRDNEARLFMAGFAVNPRPSLSPQPGVFRRTKTLISLEQAKKLGKEYEPLFEKYGHLLPKEEPKPVKKSWLDKLKSFFGFKSKSKEEEVTPKKEAPPELTKEALEAFFKNKRF